eukprot:GHVH01007852.1.p1 GENE.GHVH01007852.1~~GHVH01007852.1.p1  ORF type:complete len:1370 (+),score=184.07 GHVH01007852.1:181-4290(+)
MDRLFGERGISPLKELLLSAVGIRFRYTDDSDTIRQQVLEDSGSDSEVEADVLKSQIHNSINRTNNIGFRKSGAVDQSSVKVQKSISSCPNDRYISSQSRIASRRASWGGRSVRTNECHNPHHCVTSPIAETKAKRMRMFAPLNAQNTTISPTPSMRSRSMTTSSSSKNVMRGIKLHSEDGSPLDEQRISLTEQNTRANIRVGLMTGVSSSPVSCSQRRHLSFAQTVDHELFHNDLSDDYYTSENYDGFSSPRTSFNRSMFLSDTHRSWWHAWRDQALEQRLRIQMQDEKYNRHTSYWIQVVKSYMPYRARLPGCDGPFSSLSLSYYDRGIEKRFSEYIEVVVRDNILNRGFWLIISLILINLVAPGTTIGAKDHVDGVFIVQLVLSACVNGGWDGAVPLSLYNSVIMDKTNLCIRDVSNRFGLPPGVEIIKWERISDTSESITLRKCFFGAELLFVMVCILAVEFMNRPDDTKGVRRVNPFVVLFDTESIRVRYNISYFLTYSFGIIIICNYLKFCIPSSLSDSILSECQASIGFPSWEKLEDIGSGSSLKPLACSPVCVIASGGNPMFDFEPDTLIDHRGSTTSGEGWMPCNNQVVYIVKSFFDLFLMDWVERPIPFFRADLWIGWLSETTVLMLFFCLIFSIDWKYSVWILLMSLVMWIRLSFKMYRGQFAPYMEVLPIATRYYNFDYPYACGILLHMVILLTVYISGGYRRKNFRKVDKSELTEELLHTAVTRRNQHFKSESHLDIASRKTALLLTNYAEICRYVLILHSNVVCEIDFDEEPNDLRDMKLKALKLLDEIRRRSGSLSMYTNTVQRTLEEVFNLVADPAATNDNSWLQFIAVRQKAEVEAGKDVKFSLRHLPDRLSLIHSNVMPYAITDDMSLGNTFRHVEEIDWRCYTVESMTKQADCPLSEVTHSGQFLDRVGRGYNSKRSWNKFLGRDDPSTTLFLEFGKHWEFDVWKFGNSTNHPLVIGGMSICQQYVERDNSSLNTLAYILHCVEDKYRDLPYHNKIHGAAVLHAFAILANTCFDFEGLLDTYGKQYTFNEDGMAVTDSHTVVLATFLAAAAHDCGHLGYTDSFLRYANHDLTYTFLDVSSQENLHIYLFLSTLRSAKLNNESPIFKGQMSSKTAEGVLLRRLVVEQILATDMKRHGFFVQRFNETAQQKKDNPHFMDSLGDSREMFESYFLTLVTAAMKMADLSHAGYPWKQHYEFSLRITEEFFQQGDRERALRKVPVEKICDRFNPESLAQGQLGFFNFVITNFAKSLNKLDDSGFMYGTVYRFVKLNIKEWEAIAAKQKDDDDAKRCIQGSITEHTTILDQKRVTKMSCTDGYSSSASSEYSGSESSSFSSIHHIDLVFPPIVNEEL